jgi:hypothetical protein
MLRGLLISLIPIFVLASGLVSCQQDKKTSDVYTPTAPKMDGESLKSWEGRSNSSVDLNSNLDFSEAQPHQVEVTTRCSIDNQPLIQVYHLEAPTVLAAHDILPEKILTLDDVNGHVRCAFELTLVALNSSIHIFTMHDAPITDQNQGQVRLNQALGAIETKIFLADSKKYFIRSPIATQATATLLCTDVQFESLPFNKQMTLDSFEFATPKISAEASSDILSRHPEQLCRIRLAESEQTSQISNRFRLVFPLQPMSVQGSGGPFSAEKLDDVPYQIFSGGQALLIWEWTIDNPENTIRHLRLPPRNLSVKINVLVRDRGIGGLGTLWEFVRPWIEIRAVGQAGTGTVDIPAKGTLRIQGIVHPPSALRCPGNAMGFVLTGIEPFQIEEVDSDMKTTLSTLSPPTPSELNLSPLSFALILRLGHSPPGDTCTWN